MPSNQDHAHEVRRVAEATGLSDAEAARVVAAARIGALDSVLGPLPPLTLPKLDPHAYDPLLDTLEAFTEIETRGPAVEVTTYPLWNLVDDLSDLTDGKVARASLRALFNKLGMGARGRFDIHAETNSVPVTVAEGLLDVCAAFAGPRLVDQFDAWLARGVQGDFAAVLRGATAIYAALDGQDANDVRAAAEKLRARWHQLLARA